jgi:dihydroorotase
VRYLIKNGSILDPADRVISLGHVLVEDGTIAQVFDLAEMTPDLEPMGEDLEIIYAQACIVAPGFTDMQAHLGKPGADLHDTLATETMAAARGGFTTLCVLPTTKPPCDTPATYHYLRQLTKEQSSVHIDLIGAMTVGRQGQQLTEMAELVRAGCIAFGDDEFSQIDIAMMRNALSYASMLDTPIMIHCGGNFLSNGWAMHEGDVSTRLGLPGYPSAVEETQIAGAISLAEMTGARVHICHVSTAGGVRLIRMAKRRGVQVTADVTPHHLTLTDRWVSGALALYDDYHISDKTQNAQDKKRKTVKLDTQELKVPLQELPNDLRSPLWLDPTLLAPYHPTTRVNPPLRSLEDQEALIKGLSDGTIDAIATDHAPHDIMDKARSYHDAACGISGLETALGLVLMLVNVGALDLMNVIAKFTEGPAQILGRSPSTLRPGTPADIVIFDPEYLWTVDTAAFVSQGTNSPLHGQQLKGQVMMTMVAGEMVYRRESFGQEYQGRPRASVLSGILNNGEEEEEDF